LIPLAQALPPEAKIFKISKLNKNDLISIIVEKFILSNLY